MNHSPVRAAILAWGLLACWGTPQAAATAPTPAPLSAIASLDVPRYMGRWYEIAKIPNRFQKKCVRDTVAQYRQTPDGQVTVVNRCRTADGSDMEASGAVRQPGGASSPQLEVRFAPAWLSFLPAVWGDYWVIDLDPAYTLAAVSEPRREFLWVLSRTPTVDEGRYQALLERLRRQHLEVSALERTLQSTP